MDVKGDLRSGWEGHIVIIITIYYLVYTHYLPWGVSRQFAARGGTYALPISPGGGGGGGCR